jgi:pSer/pThr/pTyr-binding forkhead associated (FHA) protein
MQPELTLNVRESGGHVRRVAVRARRFTIGRSPDSDLFIEDWNLSRRHAIVETFDGAPYISDAGSQNGTSVNGRPINAPTPLSHGDIVSLGGSCELEVSLGGFAEINRAPQATTGRAPARSLPAATSPAAAASLSSAVSARLTTPVIAASSVVLILFVAAALALATRACNRTPDAAFEDDAQTNKARGRKEGERKETGETRVAERDDEDSSVANRNDDAATTDQPVPVDETNAGGVVPDAGTNTGEASNENSVADDTERIEPLAAGVMRSISSDPNPNIREKYLKEIGARVRGYRGSKTLAASLNAMRSRGLAQLAGAARSSGLKLPLVAYAGLAQADRAGSGDPVRAAQEMLPRLTKMARLFSTELANDSLLTVAACDEGASLFQTINRLSQRERESPAIIRNVWYLHERRQLDPRAYDFVLRFLAIGVVAQNPRQFQIDAEPLGF